MSSYNKIVIAGGTGHVGALLTRAFLDQSGFDLTVLTHSNSSSPVKEEFEKKGVKIVCVDYNNENGLVEALKGAQVVISVLPTSTLGDAQLKLIKASKKADVARFVPSEFGIDVEGNDSSNYAPKQNARKEIENSGMEYTYYLTGFFLEDIVSPVCGFKFEERVVEIIGKGYTQFTVTSLNDVVKFLVKSINLPEAKNNSLFASGDVTSLYKLAQYFKSIGYKVNYISVKDAQKVADDPNSDMMTKVIYKLRIDIENGVIFNKEDHLALIDDMVPLRAVEYIRREFK